MPSPDTFHQELSLWNNTKSNIPDTLSGTLVNNQVCHMMFPNIVKIIHIMLTSVTSAGVEIANSALKFVKNAFRSTMGEDRFNALVLMYVHKDIELDLDKIIDIFARRHPRRMILFNPLCSCYLYVYFCYFICAFICILKYQAQIIFLLHTVQVN